MVYIFAANIAVSLALGIALWMIWRMDREQLFARDVALLQLSIIPAALGYFLIKSTSTPIHVVGCLVTSAAAAGVITTALAAAMRISAIPLTLGNLLTAFGVVACLYLWAFTHESFLFAGIIGSTLLLALGLMIFIKMRGQGRLPTVIGVCFLLMGFNTAGPALFGEVAGLSIQFTVGIVLRTVLAISIIFMALSRSRERETSALQRFRELTDNSRQGVMVVDQFRVYYANPAALQLFGLNDLAEMQAAGPYIGITKQAVRDKSFVLIGKVLDGEMQHASGEAIRFRKDGTPMHLQFTGFRTMWQEQPAAHILIADNTAAHQAAQQIKALEEQREAERVAFAERIKNNLLQANAELEKQVALRTQEVVEASAAKDQFLANMSHELRTPMNAVLGMLRLVRDTELTERQRDYIFKTEAAAKSLLTLLTDVLDFSKINAGRLELESAPFSLETVLQELSVILSMNARRQNVEILFDVDRKLPARVVGDGFRIKQVLVNLCMNAIKFTEQGEVCLRITVLSSHDNSVSLRFSVIDTGIGISPQYQLQIFNMFSQADSSFTRRFGGAGLGLPIARQLVQLMGGTLTVSSALQVGSTFDFDLLLKLPQADVSEAPAFTATPAAKATDAPALPAPQANAHKHHSLHVLLVDDHAHARALLASMLQDMGHRVATADSGAQALATLAQTPFDAVVVDAFMPSMDGWQTVEGIRQQQGAAVRTPVLMLSAWGRESLEQHKQQQHQIDAFLTKPMTRSMLQDNLNMVISGRSNLRNTERTAVRDRKRLDGMHILLVEDNAINQMVASELLQGQGATVAVADNGQLALDALRDAQLPFDAVLMDMQMPVMDGCTATRKIRTELRHTALPIIAMTANTLPSDRKACMDAGMNAHVGKPFDLNYLVDVLLAYRNGDLSKLPAAPERAVAAPASETLDLSSALDRIGGELDLYLELLDAYSKDISTLPDRLDALVAAQDWSAVNRLMHSLKGNSSTVGAVAVEEVAKSAEQASEGMPGEFEAGRFPARLREVIARTLPQVQRVAQEKRTDA